MRDVHQAQHEKLGGCVSDTLDLWPKKMVEVTGVTLRCHEKSLAQGARNFSLLFILFFQTVIVLYRSTAHSAIQ